MSLAPPLPAPVPSAWGRWLPFLAWVGFVVCVFHPGSAAFSWVGKQPWGDKIAHVLLIGTAAFLLDHALARRRVRVCGCAVPLGGLVVAVGMTAEEVSQIWIPGRSFEWGDLAANYIGVTAAWAASAWIRPAPAGPSPPAPLASIQ